MPRPTASPGLRLVAVTVTVPLAVAVNGNEFCAPWTSVPLNVSVVPPDGDVVSSEQARVVKHNPADRTMTSRFIFTLLDAASSRIVGCDPDDVDRAWRASENSAAPLV